MKFIASEGWMAGLNTIEGLLTGGRVDDIAIAGIASDPLTHGALRILVARTVARLRDLGIGPEDRLAVVLPNGPLMATAFIALACGAVVAPLNPAYTADEVRFYLTDLKIRALIVEDASLSPAIEVAKALGIGVLTLAPATAAAGDFHLYGPPCGPATTAPAPGPSDIALILHTSGTTARPKIVPLTHANLAASARSVATSLALASADRALNVMPLFHIHGLVAGLLAPLSRGGAVVCTPGFNALSFLTALADSRATWFTAVPTMHQAILMRCGRGGGRPAHGLRFARSSSAPLPARLAADFESAFGVPLLESYGMTEAAHQIAANTLAGVRKPGSVGPAAGAQVAAIDEAGRHLPADAVGEIAIRGPGVTAGYENNPAANAAAFTDGWFRTGDQGFIDRDGHVFLTGRLKEIINRGGEKISPREVDEALTDHPAILQAVTFALPHDTLGEDVAAAVVFQSGQSATVHEIRDFLLSRLAPFKVPRTLIVLSELPRGPTGKLQRIGLARTLGLVG